MSTGQADQQTFNNELRGALFINDKGDNPARPDYRGNCQVNGQRYKISGWKRTARSGQVFLSLALTADQSQPPQGTPPVTAQDFSPQPTAQTQMTGRQAAPVQPPPDDPAPF